MYVGPSYSNIQTLIGQEHQYQDALSKAAELGTVRDQLLTKYNSFSQDNLSRLSRILPDSVNTVKLVTDLDSIAGRYGITVHSVQITQALVDNSQAINTSVASTTPYNTTTINFSFSATYQNLVSYLKDLEKSLQMIDIKSVGFNVPQSGFNANIYDYTVSIETYSLK
jgi:Tfp pilus assembly protein PilO